MQEEHTKVIIMSEKSKIFKNIILEILDYLRYKVENDRLTLSETESIARTIWTILTDLTRGPSTSSM